MNIFSKTRWKYKPYCHAFARGRTSVILYGVVADKKLPNGWVLTKNVQPPLLNRGQAEVMASIFNEFQIPTGLGKELAGKIAARDSLPNYN